MSKVIEFPQAVQSEHGFQRVQSTYTVGEISRQFGLSEHIIRKWTRDGFVQTAPPGPGGEVRYDFRALTLFRRVRELRAQGLRFRQIEAELNGQLNLFPERCGQLIQLPVKMSPFEEALVLHERDTERAIERYWQAITENDCVADAYCNLGILEFEAGRLPQAFDRFTQALRHDPRHFEAHFNLAHLYFESGDLRLARLHYEIAAEIEPNFPNLYFNLGLVHAISGDVPTAMTILDKAKAYSGPEDMAKLEDFLSNLKKASASETDAPPNK